MMKTDDYAVCISSIATPQPCNAGFGNKWFKHGFKAFMPCVIGSVGT